MQSRGERRAAAKAAYRADVRGARGSWIEFWGTQNDELNKIRFANQQKRSLKRRAQNANGA